MISELSKPSLIYASTISRCVDVQSCSKSPKLKRKVHFQEATFKDDDPLYQLKKHLNLDRFKNSYKKIYILGKNLTKSMYSFPSSVFVKGTERSTRYS